MAMYPCLSLPSLSFHTLTGSIVTFNSHYAGLPLKSCTSLISGYQEGTGTPSPTNVRNIVSFTSGVLTANSDTYTFTFGQNIYSGSIDWLRGVVIGNFVKAKLSDFSWSKHPTYKSFYCDVTNKERGGDELFVSNLNYLTGSWSTSSIMNQPINSIGMSNNNTYLYVNVGDISDTDFINNYGDGQIAYELETPIEIPLGGINFSTAQGTNTISADTGDTTLQYIKFG